MDTLGSNTSKFFLKNKTRIPRLPEVTLADLKAVHSCYNTRNSGCGFNIYPRDSECGLNFKYRDS